MTSSKSWHLFDNMNERNEIIDLSSADHDENETLNGVEESVTNTTQDSANVFEMFRRKTPRKKVAVEKYTDDSLLKKKKKKKTPKSKGSVQKKTKSSTKKRKQNETENFSSEYSSVQNEDGTTTSTHILVDHLANKTIITTTTTTLDGSDPIITVKEIDIPQKKSKKVKSSGKISGKDGGGKKPKMTEEEKAELIAKQIALKESIPALEEKEKAERDHLAGLKRMKVKVEKAIEAQSKIKFPIEDTLIAEMDKKGNPPMDLPPIAQRLVNVPDLLVGDVLYVWDFLTVFHKELNLKPILIDDFVELLNYRGGISPALVEVFVSLLRRVYYDHSLCNLVSADIPSHLNIMSSCSEETAKEELSDSQKIEQYRDWEYNGIKLIPKKLHRSEAMVDALKYQGILRTVIPRLPAYKELLRANDPQLDTLISMENREGVDKDGYKSPNRDALRSLTSNYAHDLNVVNEALRELETKEIHKLNMEYKLCLLSHLCRACYDTQHVRHLLARNQEERLNQLSQMTKHIREEKKKLNAVDPELKEEAIMECRAFNESQAEASSKQKADNSATSSKNGNNKNKGPKSRSKKDASTNGTSAKHPFDPSAAQLTAMIEDLKLRKTLGIDVIIDDDLGIVGTEDDTVPESTSHTARSSLAEFERKRKEREKNMLMKEDAVAWLAQALETERERDIKSALKYARQADLEGELPDGRTFCTSQMFKLYKKRSQLEVASKEARLASEHEKALTQYFIRTEPIGYDRHHRAYWCFDGDTRVFVQTSLSQLQMSFTPVNLALQSNSACSGVRANFADSDTDDGDEKYDTADRLAQESTGTPIRSSLAPTQFQVLSPSTPQGGIRQLSGMMTTASQLHSPPPTVTKNNVQLYEAKPSNTQHVWRIYGSMLEIWMLMEALDERGVRERDLKSKLRAQFGMNKNNGRETYLSTGSEYIGRKIRRTFGKKVAYGTIVGWLPPEGEDQALWHVVHDDGDEEDLDIDDITQAFNKEAEQNAPEEGVRRSARVREHDMSGDDDCDSDEEVPEVVTEYTNTVPGGLGVNSKQVGLSGLRHEMMRYEAMILEGLRRKGSSFHREGKRHWEHAVKNAESVNELKACLVTLEEVIHDTQVEEDLIDSKDTKNKKEVMLTDGWIFNSLDDVLNYDEKMPAQHSEDDEKCLKETRWKYEKLEQNTKASEPQNNEVVSRGKQNNLTKDVQKANEAKCMFDEFKEGLQYVQRKVRRFFPGHGASDGIIVAYLPAELNEGERLWHLEHDDGDTEDLDLNQVLRGCKYHDDNALEADDDDVDDDDDDDDDDNEDDESNEDGSEISDSESDEDDYADEPRGDEEKEKLWSSLNVRRRWIHATNESHTVGEVSLALFNLINSARSYGIVGEDPLAGAQGNRNSKAKSSTSGEKRKHVRINGDSTENGGRRSRKKSKGHTSSRKSASKKGSDYNRRGARSLLDRAAKRCVVNYAED